MNHPYYENYGYNQTSQMTDAQCPIGMSPMTGVNNCLSFCSNPDEIPYKCNWGDEECCYDVCQQHCPENPSTCAQICSNKLTCCGAATGAVGTATGAVEGYYDFYNEGYSYNYSNNIYQMTGVSCPVGTSTMTGVNNCLGFCSNPNEIPYKCNWGDRECCYDVCQQHCPENPSVCAQICSDKLTCCGAATGAVEGYFDSNYRRNEDCKII